MHPEVERQVDAQLVRLRVAWGATVLGVALFAALGYAIAGPALARGEPAGGPAAAVVAALGLAVAAALPLIDRRLHGPGRLAARARHPLPEHVLRHLAASHLVLWSLAEVPAILGFVQLVLGGPARTLLLLCGGALAALAYLAPTRARIRGQVEGALRSRSSA